MSIETERLFITPMSNEELAETRDKESDPHMRRAYTEMLDGCEADPAGRLWYTCWLISLRQTGQRVGDLCFKGLSTDGEVEIGYGIDSAFQGSGYATEAAGAAVGWALEQDGVCFVTAESEADNTASLRVLEKLGFRRNGQGEEGPRFRLDRNDT